jgi:hypothetical protein
VLAIIALFSAGITEAVSAAEVGYSISIYPNEHQNLAKANNLTYFDLLLEPNVETDLELVIENTSEAEASFNINITNAITLSNLEIDFTPTLERSQYLATGLTDLAKLSTNKVTVAKASKTVVPIHIKMPAEALKGVVIGGIHVIKNISEEEAAKQSGFVNQVAYVKPVVIQSSNPPEVTKAEFDISAVAVKTVNDSKRLAATISNTQPVYLKGVDVHTQVTKYGESVVLLENEHKDGAIAPCSTFDLQLDYDKDLLPPGKYTYQATFTKDDEKWVVKKHIDIKKDTAPTGGFVVTSKPFNWLLLAVGILGAIVLILLILLIILSRRKKATKEEK